VHARFLFLRDVTGSPAVKYKYKTTETVSDCRVIHMITAGRLMNI